MRPNFVNGEACNITSSEVPLACYRILLSQPDYVGRLGYLVDNSGFQAGESGGILVSDLPRILGSQELPSRTTMGTSCMVVHWLFKPPVLCNSKMLCFLMTLGKLWTSRVLSGLIYLYVSLWFLLA